MKYFSIVILLLSNYLSNLFPFIGHFFNQCWERTTTSECSDDDDDNDEESKEAEEASEDAILPSEKEVKGSDMDQGPSDEQVEKEEQEEELSSNSGGK